MCTIGRGRRSKIEDWGLKNREKKNSERCGGWLEKETWEANVEDKEVEIYLAEDTVRSERFLTNGKLLGQRGPATISATVKIVKGQGGKRVRKRTAHPERKLEAGKMR